MSDTIEIKRSKRLKGLAHLQGDSLTGFLALLLGALAEGPTRLENLPNTPWFQEILEDFIRMGYAQQALDGAWVIHGGSIPVTGPEPLHIRHEAELLPLAAFLAAQGCSRPLTIDTNCISREALEALSKIFKMEIPDFEAVDIDLASPSTLTTKGLALLKKSENSSHSAPMAAADEYYFKLILLTYQLSKGQGLELSFSKNGPDTLEMLADQFGAPIKIDRNEIPEGDELARRIARQMRAAGKTEPTTKLKLGSDYKLKSHTYSIPADISQASAFILAATLIKGSDLTLEAVPLNPSRAGFITALRRMGADIEVVSRKERQGEGYGLLRIRSSDLIGKRFGADNISAMRDDVFLLMVAAAYAEGETIIRDISGLRKHRQDLLKAFVNNLKTVGVEIGEIEDGLVIRGRPDYDGNAYDTLGNPSLGLACIVMSLKSHGASILWGMECLAGRYPNILSQFADLGAGEKT